MSVQAQTLRGGVSIPPRYPERFVGAIRHPALWLWDSWVMRADSRLHLYCLALSRVTEDGDPITPAQLNDYGFHYRHFVSGDDGDSWQDHGAVLRPGNLADGSDGGNVWSGGVYPLDDGRVLFGYTGIEHASPDRHFIQSPTFAVGSPDGPTQFPATAQSHPVRDRALITAAGYYLPDAAVIGANDGEEGGPILAWRDPFIFDDGGTLRAVWSAKLGPREPCVAHAVLRERDGAWTATLQPPIRLPDAADYTQAEVPKLCWDESTESWLMMISACDRLHEQQPDPEVTKGLRLYRALSVAGPWEPAFAHGSVIRGVDHLFGASFADRTVAGDRVRLVAPYTVKIGLERAMSFAPIQTIALP